MGVFRSDQAQVTFAAEPAQGADIERYTSATVSNASTLDGAVTSGALSITLTSGSSYVVGDFIRIGEIQTALQNVEVRRVEYKDGNVVYLDRPVAFYHADDEAEIEPNTQIASLSLGATRDFCLKHRHQPLREVLHLQGGDLLIMHPQCQKEWLHALPRRKRVLQPRINLTFRSFIKSQGL